MQEVDWTARSRQEVLDLIADLRNALRRSAKTQGFYPVCRRGSNGERGFALAVHLGSKGT